MANKPYTFSADIWSIGIIFYHMLYSDHPFKSTIILTLGINIEKEINDKCKNGYILS